MTTTNRTTTEATPLARVWPPAATHRSDEMFPGSVCDWCGESATHLTSYGQRFCVTHFVWWLQTPLEVQ